MAGPSTAGTSATGRKAGTGGDAASDKAGTDAEDASAPWAGRAASSLRSEATRAAAPPGCWPATAIPAGCGARTSPSAASAAGAAGAASFAAARDLRPPALRPEVFVVAVRPMALRSWPAVLVVVWGVAALSAVSASAAEVSGVGEAAAAVAAAAFCAAGSAVATADLADLDAARPAALRLRPEALVVAPGVAARGAAFSAAAAAAGAPSGAADEAVSLDAGFGAVAALCPVAISAADVFLRLVVRVVRRFWGDSSVAGGVSGVSVGAAVAAAARLPTARLRGAGLEVAASAASTGGGVSGDVSVVVAAGDAVLAVLLRGAARRRGLGVSFSIVSGAAEAATGVS